MTTTAPTASADPTVAVGGSSDPFAFRHMKQPYKHSLHAHGAHPEKFTDVRAPTGEHVAQSLRISLSGVNPQDMEDLVGDFTLSCRPRVVIRGGTCSKHKRAHARDSQALARPPQLPVVEEGTTVLLPHGLSTPKRRVTPRMHLASSSRHSFASRRTSYLSSLFRLLVEP
ncbi:hypothetical protein K458DRAFT_37345 [Lentithecium fluviatile CBS 122367]|uniref:Uncharacterized protein n=1 Tax=Lentithecium fluviatile CBS 122367 TaxID=1168545 RepID=A0A6G1J1K0_9PLEO|nr:hypothetical protein K458DRAFT_37345 [Lentithecium fluviatile CBS 122367]